MADMISRITIDYRRITKIKLKTIPNNECLESATWDYSERLIVDRETNTLEHIQNIGSACKVSRKYEIEYGIDSLLDSFADMVLFANVEGNPDNVIETPDESRDYTITIYYTEKPQRIITGSLDKRGLLNDFAEFAKAVIRFMRFYGMGEILEPSIYGKTKRRKEEYIYCSVEFDNGYKSYYYISDDDSIEIGDYVVVPTGRDNRYAFVEVVNIEYFTKENAPLPVDETKHIIAKYSSVPITTFYGNKINNTNMTSEQCMLSVSRNLI